MANSTILGWTQIYERGLATLTCLSKFICGSRIGSCNTIMLPRDADGKLALAPKQKRDFGKWVR
jgi:hypothetical protein